MVYSDSQDATLTSDALEVSVATDTSILCRLLWRQEKLWVVPPSARNQHIALPALAQPEWFRACLERSKAKAVVVDPLLGRKVINFWVLACAEAKKPIYLRLPTTSTLPQKQKARAWRVKCAVERILGLGLLILLSPLMLAFSVLLNMQDRSPAIVYYWVVGKNGKLFAMRQFRCYPLSDDRAKSLDNLLNISRLDRLPCLLNVVLGDMTLVGTKPWEIKDAVNLAKEYKPNLKALPGLVGKRPLGLSLPTIDINLIGSADMDYLNNWSFLNDSKALFWALRNGFSVSPGK